MSVPSIGVIGNGFVGGAIVNGFKEYTDIKVYDRDPDRTTASHGDVLKQDLVFVCLPTPMNKETGEVDVSIIAGALGRANLECVEPQKTFIIKSTVPGNFLYSAFQEYGNINIVYNPEFLTERTSQLDFQQANRHIFGVHIDILGSEDIGIDLIEKLFRFRFPRVPITWVDFHHASLVKYFTNVFFSAKISLMNEFAQICEAHDLEPNDVIGDLLLDSRIGRSHFKVPGHDGKKGFGGHCFPKDLNGYINTAKGVGVDPVMGEATWEKNLEVRPEKDWELDKGRAVS